MMLLIGLLAVSTASAAWMDSPRYGADYVGESQMSRSPKCVPCDERRLDRANSNTLDYRGNGADNLGYDWSPKAWGGPAFPKSGERNRPSDGDWGGRDGRRMPGPWNEKCRDCSSTWPGSESQWDRFTARPDNSNRPGWSSSTEHPHDVSTVTSSVLGIRLRDDRRMPVEWGGTNMRWDGFQNGMPLDRPIGAPDRMDRRNGIDFRPWDTSSKGVSDWDRDGKGHYASDWSYGSRDPAGSGTRWNGQRPWTQSWDERKPQSNDYDHRGDRPSFGSSYPTTDRFPSNNYGSSASSYPTSTWRPSTSNKPYYNYPTSGRPGSGPPEIITVRPGYGVVSRPDRPTQDNGAPWNYSPNDFANRPSQWPSRPNENYLPQNNRPTSPGNDYGRPTRPYDGVPGTALWNGRPDDYRPGQGQGSRPPSGFYQGFITEIHDPNYAQGNKFPNNRPGYNENRYPSDRPLRPTDGGYNNQDRYPSNQYPNGNRYPDRYDKPGQGNNNFYENPRPSNNHNNNNWNQGYDSNRDKYPDQGYGNNRPGYGRYPSVDTGDRNQYGNDRDRDRYPGYDRDRDRDRTPNYGNQHNSRPQYGDSGYPGSDRDRDRYPSDSNKRPSYGQDGDRYPSRPSSSDHDRGPNPGSDQGSWNYGEDGHKDGTYRRSGGSYPPYKGGQYFTSGYLASASTPAASSQEGDQKHDETTVATSSQEK